MIGCRFGTGWLRNIFPALSRTQERTRRFVVLLFYTPAVDFPRRLPFITGKGYQVPAPLACQTRNSPAIPLTLSGCHPTLLAFGQKFQEIWSCELNNAAEAMTGSNCRERKKWDHVFQRLNGRRSARSPEVVVQRYIDGPGSSGFRTGAAKFDEFNEGKNLCELSLDLLA
jgi:hypothetical protein